MTSSIARSKRGSPVWRRAAWLTAIGVPSVSLLGPVAAAQTAASWLAPANGQWTDASKWSTNPAYPRTGAPTPADTFAVSVGVVGGAYAITLDASAAPTATIAVDRLTLGSADATVIA